MSDESAAPDCHVWWRYAVEDLAQADLLHADEHGSPRWVCTLSQQAAEKALKAALVFLGTDFPRTHDLVRLKLLLPADWTVVTGDVDLTSLRRWAVRSRYPADWPEPTVSDADEASRIAHTAVELVRHDLTREAFLSGPVDTTPPEDSDRAHGEAPEDRRPHSG